MRVDLVELLDRVARFNLVLVQQPQVLLLPVEVKASNGLSVVVIEQHGEIALGIAMGYPLRLYLAASDRLDDLVALEFFESGLDLGVAIEICLHNLGTRRRRRVCRVRDAAHPERGLQAVIHPLVEELMSCLPNETGELLSNLLRV